MKALVVYGTRWGGTTDIAETIGETLNHCGYVVDVVDAKKSQPEIDPYDLVIVGSGISMGKWTKEVMSFLEKNATGLESKKTACFVSCGMVLRQQGREKALQDYLVKIAEKYCLSPVSYGVFGGFLDFDKSHGFLGNFFVNSSKKKLQKMGVDTTRPYDFRNWDAIRSWTRKLTDARVLEN